MKTRTLTHLTLGFACCLAAGAVTAEAQTQATATKSTKAALEEKDTQFINDAASGGMFEIEASKLALTRSTDPKIKDFAKHMVDEHTKNAAMLKKVAMSKGAVVPTKLAPAEQKMLDELKAEKAGKDFDDAYCKAMLNSHKDAVGKYMGAKDDVADSDLRAYAATSLPTLQHHTDMAETLNKTKS